jgi:hypothetical protein
MGIQFWLVVVLTLVLGAGFLLLIPGLHNLTRCAKALDMWPDRKDEPGPIPGWVIWPEWSYALFADLFRRSAQRDGEYVQLQRRVRWGLALTAIGFVILALLPRLLGS